MIREHIKIHQDLVRRKCFLKTEIRNMMWKSIFQNRQTENTKRFFCKLLISSQKKKNFISKQKKKCVLSGSSKGIYKIFELNRHVIKKLNNMGMLQNVTTKK